MGCSWGRLGPEARTRQESCLGGDPPTDHPSPGASVSLPFNHAFPGSEDA